MRRLKYLALSVLILGGCAGTGDVARERALLPALRSAWPGVEADVTRGIADGVEDSDITVGAADGLIASSQKLGDVLGQTLAEARAVAPMEWSILRPWAMRGVDDRVDDREISTGVAVSFNERITQFDAAIDKLQGEVDHGR